LLAKFGDPADEQGIVGRKEQVTGGEIKAELVGTVLQL